MNPAQMGVVSKPARQNFSYDSLLAANKFDELAQQLKSAQQIMKPEVAGSHTILKGAIQLCASCTQLQNEVAFHEQACQQTKTRRDNLKTELSKLLDVLWGSEETAVSPPNDMPAVSPGSDHKPATETGQTISTIWQRVSTFFQGEKPEMEVLPESTIAPQNPLQPIQISASEQSSSILELKSQGKKRPQLSVYCLGTFIVYQDEKPIVEWPSRKGQAIFKYLLLHRQQRITKEVLMAEFWPEAAAEAARNNLNVAIYGLRQALRHGYPDFSHILFQDDCYFLNPEMEIWLDLEAFEDACQQAFRFQNAEEPAAAFRKFHVAELLYEGELFAEDRYEDWPTTRRQQLCLNYLQVLTCLCDHYFATGQYATSIAFAHKLLHIEPCQEATHRLLMRAYAHQGQGYLALRQYHQCVKVLKEELEVAPEPTTDELYERIRCHKEI